MAKLKFLAKLKKLKAKRKNPFFNRVRNNFVDLKFWLIALLPFLFLIYNYMRKRKKARRRWKFFYSDAAWYAVFTAVALIFTIFIFNANMPAAGRINPRPATTADAADQNYVAEDFSTIMDETENYLRKNMAVLAAANSAGGGGSTIDSVNFINVNRALIFYHENADKYLAEVVFDDQRGQVSIAKFILKIKNDIDYSGGVYGAD